MSYRWELLAWLWIAFLLNQADRQAFNVVLPALSRDLGLSFVQLGAIASVFTAALAVTAPFAGFIGDRVSRKTVVVLSVLAWSATTLWTGFGASLWFFIGVRSLATAVGEASFAPSAFAMISAEHSATRARAFGIFQTAVYAGLIASGWLAGAVAQRFGWRAVFWSFGAFGMVLAVIMQRRLRDVSYRDGGVIDVRPALTAIVCTPTARFVALAAAAMIFVNVAYLTWTPTFLYERFHMSLAEAGLASMLFHHVAAFGGVAVGGVVSDRLAPSRPRVRLELQGAALAAGVPFLIWLGRATTQTGVFAALAGFGFFRGVYDSNTYPALYAVIAPRFHASASGLLIAFAFLAGSLAPFLLAKAKVTIGLASGLSLLSAVYAAGGVMALWGAERYFMPDFLRVQEART